MKRLELPHRMADYLCPVNGLCDVYEWKTGKRIPEELIFYAKAGFQMISQKRADAPKMIFLGQGSIGKREYEFWKEIIGYEIMFGEGKCFRTTWKEICALLDREIPTILFGLDMFYLPYQQKFYQKQHIPGHVVLMVGYDDENAYIHDNSKEGVQPVPLSNLEQAWAKSYIGICKKNTYFGINMKSPETDISQIIQKGMATNAEMYLHSALSFVGQKGLDKFMKEFPKWKDVFAQEALCKIYLHFIEYTGSVLPELPYEISGSRSGIINPHRASRDKLAQALLKYQGSFGVPEWEDAAYCFECSGQIIQTIVGGFIEDVGNMSFGNSEKYIPFFQELREYEECAFHIMLRD